MKNMFFLVLALVCFTSCGSGKGAGEGGVVNNTQDIRTSSDMNITPSNYTVQDPAVTMDTISQKQVTPSN